MIWEYSMRIIPKQEKTSFCVTSCIKHYLRYLNAPYAPMLLCNWSMGPVIENEITLPYCVSPLDVLDAFSETKVKTVVKDQAVAELIQQEVQNNKPIISYVDSFYCDWMTYFEKIQADHFVMIIGEDESVYHVLDPYLNDFINLVSRKVIHQGLGKANMGNHYITEINEKLFLFEKVGFKKNDVSDIVKIAANKYKDSYSNYMLELQRFFYDFDNIFSLLGEADISHNKFYFDIKSIVDSRNDFEEGLLYCKKTFTSNIIYESDVVIYEEILALWRTFLSCLYRFAYSSSLEKKKNIIFRAQEYLEKIIHLELFFAKRVISN